jgi:hypothetical protein
MKEAGHGLDGTPSILDETKNGAPNPQTAPPFVLFLTPSFVLFVCVCLSEVWFLERVGILNLDEP